MANRSLIVIVRGVIAFIITSISAFYGYYAKGNSLEVGAASTKAVVEIIEAGLADFKAKAVERLGQLPVWDAANLSL